MIWQVGAASFSIHTNKKKKEKKEKHIYIPEFSIAIHTHLVEQNGVESK